MRLLGIALASLSNGLGELTFFQLSTTYRSNASGHAVGDFASGTGAAGLLGASLWWGLRSVGVKEGIRMASVRRESLEFRNVSVAMLHEPLTLPRSSHLLFLQPTDFYYHHHRRIVIWRILLHQVICLFPLDLSLILPLPSAILLIHMQQPCLQLINGSW